MRRIASISILLFALHIGVHAQQYPPVLLYTLSGGVPTPATGSGTTLPTMPPPMLCYGINGSGQAAPCVFSGSGSGTVNNGTIYSPAYYASTGTAVSGTTPFTGLEWWSGSAAPTAATAANVVSVIGATGLDTGVITNIAIGGAPAGGSASVFLQKTPSSYGYYCYDNSGSTTIGFPCMNAETYGITGTLSGTHANYRSHLDQSNSTASTAELFGYISGNHAQNGIAFGALSDGTYSISMYEFNLGSYGRYALNGLAPYNITNVVSNGGNCQITISGVVSFLAGAQNVTIASVGGATACNGTFSVLSIDSTTQFTVNQAFSGTYTSGGTAFVNVSTVDQSINHYSTGDVFDITLLNATSTATIFKIITPSTFTGKMWTQTANGSLVSQMDYAGNLASTTLEFAEGYTFSHAPRVSFQMATGQISSVTTNEFFSTMKTTFTGVLEGFTGSAGAFTCTGNPTIVIVDCGTTAGSCSSPTTLASVTITAAGTTTSGSITSSTVSSGHWLAQGTSSGTCSVLNANSSAIIREN